MMICKVNMVKMKAVLKVETLQEAATVRINKKEIKERSLVNGSIKILSKDQKDASSKLAKETNRKIRGKINLVREIIKRILLEAMEII